MTKNDKYQKFILEHIEKNGYALGKELNELLQNRFGIESANGRKIIQRAVISKIIKSSEPITFGNGQYAYLHRDKILNKDILLNISKLHRPPLYRIIKTMDKNNGIISLYDFQKIAATPVIPGISKIDSSEKLISELRELGLADDVQDEKGTHYLISPLVRKKEGFLIRNQYNNMRIDAMFVPDILKSLQKFNLIDRGKMLYRSKQNCTENIYHQNLFWDAIAYSKSTGINPIYGALASTPEKQTLVLLDIVVSRSYTEEDLNGFIARIQILGGSVKQQKKKVLPIIVYNKLDTDKIESLIGKLGFIAFDLGSIYGARIYEIIQNLIELKSRENEGTGEAPGTEKTIEDILRAMKDAGQEDNLNNIKGDLFEFLMFPLFKILYPDCDIAHGRKLKLPDIETAQIKPFEYDYIITSSRYREVVIIELKGYSSSSYISLGDHKTQNSIKFFFDNRFLVAKKKFLREYPNYKITGCYITSTGFKNDGLVFLEGLNSGKIKPSKVDCWYDGKKLLELLDQEKLKKEMEIIQKYYT